MNIELFKNEDLKCEVRSFRNEQQQIFFVLSDICKILGLQTGRVKSRLKPDGVTSSNTIDKLGRKQKSIIINEANLYRCIMQSKKTEAVAFQDWIVEEVLPAIRQTGVYAVKQPTELPPELPRYVSKAQKMWKAIEEYARLVNIHPANAWEEYTKAFKQKYNVHLEKERQKFCYKHNIAKISMIAFVEAMGWMDEALEVAEIMVNAEKNDDIEELFTEVDNRLLRSENHNKEYHERIAEITENLEHFGRDVMKWVDYLKDAYADLLGSETRNYFTAGYLEKN